MDGETKNEKFYLKGLDGRALCTDGDKIQIGLDNRAFVLKEEKEAADVTKSMIGSYIIEGYENNKNDWHYVDVTELDAANGVYKWKNRAGVSWTLTKKQGSDNKLDVSSSCPYYKHGYKEATLIFDEDGKVEKIEGPWREMYRK